MTSETTDVASSSAPTADLSSLSFWALTARQRDEVFADLRRNDPVSRQLPPEGGFIPATDGFWAVVRHKDVRYVSRHPELFCSGEGVSFDDIPAEVAESAGAFLGMDEPRHSHLRGLVTHAFTPRQVRKITEQIHAQATEIVSDAIALGTVEAVKDVAKRLPLWTISEMLGVGPEERDEMYQGANIVTGTADEEFVHEGDDQLLALLGGLTTLHSLAHRMQDERRVEPQDDLMTALIQAELDGKALTADEIASFLVLLAVAGTDTTRNTIAHGIKAFSDFPEQWDLLRSDPEKHMGSAVEELVRWASPVYQFRRTATQRTELGGRQIEEGDKVVIFYTSANRDEEVFDRPWEFDITRRPNEHLGFGGGGPHFCLGAVIARTQLRAIFGEFAKTVRKFDAAEPDMVVGNFIHNVRRMSCTLHVDENGAQS